jgi:3-phytase
MKAWLVCGIVTAAAALAACAPATGDAPARATTPAAALANVRASAQTPPTASGKTDAAVVTFDAAGAGARIVATAALAGLEVYDLDGHRQGNAGAGEASAVDVAYGVDVGGKPATVIVAIDATGNRLRLFAMDGAKLSEVGAGAMPLGFAVEGLCVARNPLDGALYAFALGRDGEVDQQLIYPDAGGKLAAREVRRLHLPSESKQCVADGDGHVYVAEESVGIWRFDADPESEVSIRLIDAPRLGHLGKKVTGVAWYDGGKGDRYLLAADASHGRINVYDPARQDAFVGSFAVGAPDTSAVVAKPGTLFATSMALGGAFPHGMLLVNDEDGGANYKLVSMAAVTDALGLKAGVAQDPRHRPASSLPTVTALVETVPVASVGDAADDPVIWANPGDPSRSLVVATDKKAGMYVYDMHGKVTDFRADGKMNTTDLREGFMLGGKPAILVTASDRTHKTIAIYRLDPATRKLVDVADGPQATGLEDPYGLCMYRSARSGKTYVFINSPEGLVRQWELRDAGNGRVRAVQVRDFRMHSQAEGCVADDANGMLYINEEDVATWRLGAEPDGGDAMTAIGRVDGNPALKDDLEGIAIYDLGDGHGYIVLSSQGNNTYAVYRRDGDHAYLGSFAVVADGARGIDGASETDGLDVSSRNLGPGFGHGAMVTQDGHDVLPAQTQNYKYVPWESIARALHLETARH